MNRHASHHNSNFDPVGAPDCPTLPHLRQLQFQRRRFTTKRPYDNGSLFRERLEPQTEHAAMT